MEFWNKKVNVSEEAARLQISIINRFDSQKRMRIALDLANMDVHQTRQWIKSNNPHFSENEITLEFVRLMHYETKEMKEMKEKTGSISKIKWNRRLKKSDLIDFEK